MDFHTKLKSFFDKENISNKEISKRTGKYSEVMIGRYLNKNKPNFEFLRAIGKEFPNIDFNYLLKDDTEVIISEKQKAITILQETIDTLKSSSEDS